MPFALFAKPLTPALSWLLVVHFLFLASQHSEHSAVSLSCTLVRYLSCTGFQRTQGYFFCHSAIQLSTVFDGFGLPGRRFFEGPAVAVVAAPCTEVPPVVARPSSMAAIWLGSACPPCPGWGSVPSRERLAPWPHNAAIVVCPRPAPIITSMAIIKLNTRPCHAATQARWWQPCFHLQTGSDRKRLQYLGWGTPVDVLAPLPACPQLARVPSWIMRS